MNIIILQVLITLILGLSVEIRKGRCNDTPESICGQNGKRGVVATSENLKELIAMLRNNGIPNAYVYGWNDHILPMVLYANGSLAPFDKFNNRSDYAFCAIECPCPVNNVVYSTNPQPNHGCHQGSNLPGHNNPDCCSRPPQHCPPCEPPHHHPQHCPPCEPPHHHPQHCPPCEPPHHHPKPFPPCHRPRHHHRRHKRRSPCDSSSSPSSSSSSSSSCSSSSSLSSSSSSHEKMCPTFVRQHKKSFKNKKCHGEKPLEGCEIISCQKNFRFECGRNSSYVLSSFEQNNVMRHEKFWINEKRTDCKKLNIPEILCCPSLLWQFKKHLEDRRRCKVCLYINDKSCIFVLINNCLYFVKIGERHHKMKIRTIRLSKRKVTKLIKEGLYGVSFE